MPIDRDELSTTFVVVGLTETIAHVESRLPPPGRSRDYAYVVIPASDGRFIVEYWGRIARIAQERALDPAQFQIGQLPNLAAPSETVDISISQRAAENKRDTQPNNRLVVVQNGAVIGLLVEIRRGSDDPFAVGPSTDIGAMVLGPGEVLGVNEPIPKTPEMVQADDRVINSWIDSPPPGPLTKGTSYRLRFNVDSPRQGAITASIDVARLFKELPPDMSQIEVLVVLDTDDFEIESEDQLTLIVPRQGKSKTVTFDIVPKRDGLCIVRALFFANGRMFQKMTISLQVGPVMQVESSGLTLDSAVIQPFRKSVNLSIFKEPAGYKFLLQSGGVSRATLNLSEAQIADWIKNARQVFYDIVFQRVDGKYISQLADTKLSEDVYKAHLRRLAEMGTRLYNGLFYDSGDTQAMRMGDVLRELSARNELNVSVVAERFTFPWAMLYDGDDYTNPEPDRFWGFKHIIEYMPEFTQPNTTSYTPQIAVKDTLPIAFVCNDGIDAQFKTTVMAEQHDYLNKLNGVSVTSYPTTGDLVKLLQDPNAPPLIYFYCHADSKLPSEGSGVDDSSFALTDGTIKLSDLKLRASNRNKQMGNAPLVFINACEGAELSPYLYDGLVPYLVQRGARGVIGTEVKTPVLFGAEFGKEFMLRFTAGNQPVGALLRDLRREYRDNKFNVLGLVYSLYSSGDVVVQRGA